MPDLHILRVFVGQSDVGGNPLGVFLDGPAIRPDERQRVAAELGFSETVFVDDAGRGEVRIFAPAVELDFAGHPMVGAAWLLAREREAVPTLRPPAGEVPVRAEGELTYVAGRPDWAPPFEFAQLASPEEVEGLVGPPGGQDLIGAWAWLDERAGLIRERVFADRLGVPEDEATGAAAVRLGAMLGRPLDVRQGRGSRILVRPRPDGMVEIGGRVSLDEVRRYSPAGLTSGPKSSS